jgi:hypothetical protein
MRRREQWGGFLVPHPWYSCQRADLRALAVVVRDRAARVLVPLLLISRAWQMP